MAHHLLFEFVHQQTGQLKVAKVVSTNLHLKTVLGVAPGTRHDTSVQKEQVYG